MFTFEKGHRMAKGRASERGAAAVEFALILPILLSVVFGIVEFGWAFGQQVSLGNAAREAARTMAIHWAESDAETEAISEGLAAAPLTPDATIEFSSIECAPTNPDDVPLSVTAVASLEAPGLTGWFNWLFAPERVLTAESKMICGG
jgi:Flp pilus assembly protein TadG